MSHRCARNAAASRYQRRYGFSPTIVLSKGELCRRAFFRECPDRPMSIKQVELRDCIGQVEAGGPISVEGPDVTPIGVRRFVGPHAGLRKMMRHRFSMANDIGDDVLAEIPARIGAYRIAA